MRILEIYGAEKAEGNDHIGSERSEGKWEKSSRSERSENITDREKSSVKIEKKIVVRRSKRRIRKVLWSRLEGEVQYRTTQSKEKTILEKTYTQRRKSTWNYVNNAMRTTTDTREDNNGGATEMQDNRDGRHGQR